MSACSWLECAVPRWEGERRRSPIRSTGERVDNGQHILTGAYRETFAFCAASAPSAHVHLQPGLAVEIIDRTAARSRLACPAAAVAAAPARRRDAWDAIGLGAIAWRCMRMRASSAAAVERRRSRDATVRQWLDAARQTPRLIELLWEPLAVAALNQSIDEAAARCSARCSSRHVHKRGAGTRRSGLVRCALDELYTIPAKAFVEARGGEVKTERARARQMALPWPSVHVRSDVFARARRSCARAWYALPHLFDERRAAC